ncbi:MAG: hypothetical protein DRM98_01015 [Thermoplasmata archaeon]|nr:MAG: hypothetical protein DRM98_01015 [Thermoplasmata archaeon]
MIETKFRDNTPKKRYLITKGELPESAGGGKSTIKERIIFVIISATLIILILVLFKFFNIM